MGVPCYRVNARSQTTALEPQTAHSRHMLYSIVTDPKRETVSWDGIVIGHEREIII